MSKKRGSKKLLLLIIAPLCVVIITATILGLLFVSNNDSNKTRNGLDSCPENINLFTKEPVRLSDINYIIPLGNVSPPDHTFPTDHVYFNPPRLNERNFDDGVKIVNVYSPGNVTVTRVWKIYQEMKGRYDYTLFFSPCKEIEGFFIHLETLEDNILNELEFGDCEERCEQNTNIKLSAGERIGAAGGKGVGNFDLGLYDERVELTYANPKRWSGRMDHNVCPFDYFSEPLKSKYYAKLGTYSMNEFAPSTTDPLCGTIEQDVPGTAKGVWFHKGAKKTFPENDHLALINDNFDGSKQVLSIGESLEKVDSGKYLFTPDGGGLVDKKFETVEVENIYCYETIKINSSSNEKINFILKIDEEDNLMIEALNDTKCGSGPWLFTENAVEFER